MKEIKRPEGVTKPENNSYPFALGYCETVLQMLVGDIRSGNVMVKNSALSKDWQILEAYELARDAKL